jgi:hypothetical protein
MIRGGPCKNFGMPLRVRTCTSESKLCSARRAAGGNLKNDSTARTQTFCDLESRHVF